MHRDGRREHLQLDQQSLEVLVAGTHADIRQVLNLLSTFRLNATAMNYDQAKALCVDKAVRAWRVQWRAPRAWPTTAADGASVAAGIRAPVGSNRRMTNSTKNLTLGPFDLIGKFLSNAPGDPMPTVDDLLNYYFYDFSLMPLMVQVWGQDSRHPGWGC